jgi:hypothetical protein
MPVVRQPSFADAGANWTSPALTTKGKVLSAVIAGMQGAANGMAASAPTNGGRTSPGWGPGMAAGFAVPFENEQRRLALQSAEQERQLRGAQIATLPAQVELERRLKQSEIDSREAQANRRENYTIPGVGLVTPDDSQPNGYRVVVPEPGKDQSIDLMLAHSVAQAIKEGRDPSKDPTVQQLQAVKDSSAKDATNDPEYRDWKAQNPNAPISQWLKLRYPRENGNGGVPADDINIAAQGLVDGTLGVQALGRMAQGQKLAVITAAKKLDPSFDMTTFPARQKVATDFAAGKEADQIQSFNTFLAHARDLSDAVNDFRNTRSPLINKPLNWLRRNAGDPAVSSYLAKIEPVATEFMTFLQANHALTESDKSTAAKILDANASPAQMQSVIKSFAHTAALRLREINKRYVNTMHRDYPGLLDPENAQFLVDTDAASALMGKGGVGAKLQLRGTGATPQPQSNDPLGLFQ